MNASPSEAGLLASLRGLLATVLATLRIRGELLVVEFEEEKSRMLSVLLFGAAAFFFLSFGLVMLAIFLTALFWDTYRLLVIGTFTGLFLTIGIAALWALRGRLQRGSRMFSASLRELEQDGVALRSSPTERGKPGGY